MITVLNDDCIRKMKEFPDEFIDLTVTSPPYDNLRDYNGNSSFAFEEIAEQMYRITKKGGVVVWVVNDAVIKGSETGTSFRQALYFKECGFNLHDTMIYMKDGITFPDSNRYQQCFEYMFVFSKGSPKTFNLIHDRKNKCAGQKMSGTERLPDGSTIPISGRGKSVKEFGCRWNIWQYNAPKADGRKYKHPAIFPLDLAQDHILSWSNEGDLVLDCFMGSGTVGVACNNTKRNFIGIEKDKNYYEIALKRITERQQQKELELC